METLTKSAADLFKIAVIVAGFDGIEVMREVHRLQRGRHARANATTVERALGIVLKRFPKDAA